MFLKFLFSVVVVGVLTGCATDDGVQKHKQSSSMEQDDEIFQKWKKITKNKSSGDLIHMKVDYSGKYKISEMDEHLIKTYHRRFYYGEYKKGKRVFRVPKYEYLKMSRAGNDWKINIDEKIDGKFTIKGKNSEGKKLDTICKTLKECLKMI